MSRYFEKKNFVYSITVSLIIIKKNNNEKKKTTKGKG